MTLPKWAVTVTPLSKILALIIFIAFPIIGFILGMQYQKMIDVSQNSVITLPSNSNKRVPNSSPDATSDEPSDIGTYEGVKVKS